MKRLAAWMLSLTMALTLTACGGGQTPDAPSQTEPEVQQAEEPVHQETTRSDYGSLTVTADGVGEMVEQTEVLRGGTNQNEAVLLPLNTRLTGKTTEDGGLWYAFTTGGAENATYRITMVNKTPDTGRLCLHVYDMFGEAMNRSRLEAFQDGKAATLSLQLPPNTTYYIYIWADKGDSIQYTLRIHGPEEPTAESGTATVEQEPLVFETPFELNSTQVMFKAESDAFINEEDAKEALKPVAEVILAHPDHKILLAGTTATDGSQQARVELSNRRAAAVKGLLVSAFGVPEDQLLTIGLGFEADPFVRGQDRDANGKFVESEGAKNRRVVVMDANDPIAQELLNS